MKQRLTKKPDFNKLTLEEQYTLLHEAELRVQRLERISEGLIFWRDGSDFQKEAVAEYNEYCEEEKLCSELP